MTGADEVLEVSTAAQHKAMSHPFRQRLLLALGRRSATISQLAVTLDARKGNVGHHLKVLREAGLVRIAATRQVRGGTEQYYERTARRIVVAGNEAAPTAALLGAVTAEIAADPGEPLLTVRHVRLSAEQADRLAGTLAELVAEQPGAGDGEPTHGMLVALWVRSDGRP